MTDLNENWSLWGLFLSAFISSTLLPGGSEAILALLATSSVHERWLLFAIATGGNTLGGISSWLIGRLMASRFSAQRMQQGKYVQAIERIRKWGSPILLFSWLPIIGDPLCLAAGWLKINFFYSALFIAIGKAARYAVILWIV